MKALPAGKPGSGGKKPAGGRPFAKGFDPRRNTKAGPGRPRSEFLDRCRLLAAKTVPEDILADIDPKIQQALLVQHPGMYLQIQALRHRVWVDLADRGYDRPAAKQTVDDETEQRFVEGVPILDIDEWRKKFAARNAP